MPASSHRSENAVFHFQRVFIPEAKYREELLIRVVAVLELELLALALAHFTSLSLVIMSFAGRLGSGEK